MQALFERLNHKSSSETAPTIHRDTDKLLMFDVSLRSIRPGWRTLLYVAIGDIAAYIRMSKILPLSHKRPLRSRAVYNVYTNKSIILRCCDKYRNIFNQTGATDYAILKQMGFLICDQMASYISTSSQNHFEIYTC